MGKEDNLIYDLIFSAQDIFKIDISIYIEDIYKYEEFTSRIKKILKKSKVYIVSNNIQMGSKTIIWEIKVKK